MHRLVEEQFPAQAAPVREDHVSPLVVTCIVVQVRREDHVTNAAEIAEFVARYERLLCARVALRVAERRAVREVVTTVGEQATLDDVMCVERDALALADDASVVVAGENRLSETVTGE